MTPTSNSASRASCPCEGASFSTRFKRFVWITGWIAGVVGAIVGVTSLVIAIIALYVQLKGR